MIDLVVKDTNEYLAGVDADMATVENVPQDVCLWEYNTMAYGSWYETSCENKFYPNLDHCSLEDDGYVFCPFCSKKIMEAE